MGAPDPPHSDPSWGRCVATIRAMTRIVLASASPARADVLRNAGVEPIIQVSDVDEEALLATIASDPFPDQVLQLAQAKCEAVAPSVDGDVLILGCDSMFELDGGLFGKPQSAEQARRRLQQMSERTGTLHTGHWLIDPARKAAIGAVASTDVTISTLSADDIEAYLATGEPLHVAGSFTIDGLGGAFVDSVHGDPWNVVGLSLPLLRAMVSELGFTWSDFWAQPGR